jgi:hypothetical protein
VNQGIRGPARLAALLAALLVALLVIGCAGPAATVIRFEDSRVEVRASVERASDGALTVVAEYRPTEPNLHLYGQELPDGGIDGAGRPTRLVVNDAAWQAIGDPVASVDSELITLAGFDAPFATYPDGPVTLRQAIEPSGGLPPDETLEMSVTFMACSSAGLCYVPVEGVVVVVPLP